MLEETHIGQPASTDSIDLPTGGSFCQKNKRVGTNGSQRVATVAIQNRPPPRDVIVRPWDKPVDGTSPPAVEPCARLQSTPEFPNASGETVAVAAEPPVHFEVSNLVLDFRPNKPRKKGEILI